MEKVICFVVKLVIVNFIGVECSWFSGLEIKDEIWFKIFSDFEFDLIYNEIEVVKFVVEE